ncbi:MAG: hypothetical protein M1338_01060 [Patescibacteria group bacterium]|nr:hypothetical protein [Patescibacteria group bacterium]
MNFGDITPEIMEKLSKKTLSLYNSDQTRKFSVVAIICNKIPLLSVITHFENMSIANSVFKDEVYFIIETKLAYVAINATTVLKGENNNLDSLVLDFVDIFLRREEQDGLDGTETILAKNMLENRSLIIIPKSELTEALNASRKQILDKQAEEVMSAMFDGQLYIHLTEATIEKTPEEFCAILSYYRESHLRLEPIPGAYFIPLIQKGIYDDELPGMFDDEKMFFDDEKIFNGKETFEEDEDYPFEFLTDIRRQPEEHEKERLNSLAKLFRFLENTMI